jgi:hypothetical protein
MMMSKRDIAYNKPIRDEIPRNSLSIHQRYTKSGVELRTYKAQKGIVEHRLAGYSENNIQTEIDSDYALLPRTFWFASFIPQLD